MASYTITEVTSTTVSFHVIGLTVGQNTRFRVRLDAVADDRTVDQDVIATATTMDQTFGGLLPETKYACNIKLVADDGASGPWLGTQRFTTKAASTRPGNWAFHTTVESGSPILLTADEWNEFCTRINEFANYCKQPQTTFTTVSSGTPISAAIVNEARTAINDLPGHGTLPTAAYTGGPITASFFNGLASALNSIS